MLSHVTHFALTFYLQLQVRLPSGSHFGVSAASADSPDSFELFSMKTSSPEFGHTQIQNEQSQQGQQQIHGQGNQQGIVGDKSKETIAQDKHGNTGGNTGGKLPHEIDFEPWKDEVPDKPATAYKTQEEQFGDLHDRLGAIVCFFHWEMI